MPCVRGHPHVQLSLACVHLCVGLQGTRGEPGCTGPCGHQGPGHGGILFGFKGQETLRPSPASLEGSLLCALPLRPLNNDSGDS